METPLPSAASLISKKPPFVSSPTPPKPRPDAKVRAQRKQERAAAKRRPENVADASTGVNFDDALAATESVEDKTDLSSDDLKVALQYYANFNKQFLLDVLVKHLTETELEGLFNELQQHENQGTELDQCFTSHGNWTFDDYNQRFIGIPLTNMRAHPPEIFKTDPYPYRLPTTVRDENHEPAESDDKKSQSTPRLSSRSKKHKSFKAKEYYVRVGDIKIYEDLVDNSGKNSASPFNSKKVTLMGRAKSEPKQPVIREDVAATDSVTVHPNAAHQFTPPSSRKIPRDTSEDTSAEICDPAAPRSYYPDHSELAVLNEYVQNYKELIWACGAAVYLVDPISQKLHKVTGEASLKVLDQQGHYPTVVALRNNQCVVSNHIDHDLRYPISTGDDDATHIKHIMAIPFRDPDGTSRGVVEFFRTARFPAPFTEALLHAAVEDVNHFAYMLYKAADCRREINIYRVLGKRFQDLFVRPKNLDHIIYRIMILIKTQLNPDRVHLFRMDTDRKHATASVYDTGKCSKRGYHFDYSRTVKIPIATTFLSDFVQLKQTMNVKRPSDAWIAGGHLEQYLPGPPITNTLVMPFTDDLEGKMCEFVLLINSSGANGFTTSDEDILAALLTFFLSAIGTLSYRYRVAATSRPLKAEGDLFCRLSNESAEDVEELLRMCQGAFMAPDEFYTHDFYCKPFLEENLKLPYLFLIMMEDLFGNGAFDRRKMASFALAVREGYRSVRYHGWHHGFNVAHAMFIMLRDNRDLCTDLERKSLMIATICHDLDHLGFNNAFAKKFISPLEKLYPTSQMENHHIRETFRILSITANDIFHNWPEEDKAETAVLIKEAILATDLALYFAGKKPFELLVDTGELHLENPDHRHRLMNIMMNACDLTASTKPWETQAESTRDLYDEFYAQGDIEKRYGEPPIPMLDRDNAEYLAREQIGFLRYVCLPLYTLVSRVLPSTQCLVDACVTNIMHWEREVVRGEEAKAARLAVDGGQGVSQETLHPDPSDVQVKGKRPRTPRDGNSDVDVKDKHGKGTSKSPRPKGGKADDKGAKAKTKKL